MTRKPSNELPLRARISPELTAGGLVVFLTIPVSLLLVTRAVAFTLPAFTLPPEATPVASIVEPPLTAAPSKPASTRSPTSPSNPATIRAALGIERALAKARAELQTLVAEDPVSAGEIAAELRGINASVNAGRLYATSLARTPKTERIGRELLDVYDAVHELTIATLAHSLQDTDSYVEGARDVISTLGNLRTADRALEELDEAG